jgi:murein DD-endopeptidase MepM/ murein hydrolase activator NlpD
MRRKEYSFLIFNHTGSPIKKLSISGRLITSSLCIGTVVFIGLTILAVDYLSLKRDASRSITIAEELTQQNDLIDHQKNQIQNFANQINELKYHLSELNEFEKKMRIIANFDDGDDETDGVFGVGGSMPEDLDPSIELNEMQSALLQEMHEQVSHLDQVAVSQQERFETLFGHMQEQRNILACTPTIRPVEGGYISSIFGYRISPFTERKEFHKGLDIATQMGTPIAATADGVVSFSGEKGTMGNMIVINHGYGFTTRYGHCKELLKKKGDAVKRGEVIATVGNSGRSTGPHVHYEVQLNKVQVNPNRYILN